MFKYSINLIWSDADECYVANIPEFPGLSAHGYSPEEAVEEAHAAADLFVEDIVASGGQVPKPTKLIEHSGQLRVRLPKSLHSSLSVVAEREGVSLNTLIVAMLSEGSSAYKIADKICRHIDERFDEISVLPPVRQEVVYLESHLHEVNEGKYQRVITFEAENDDKQCGILH